MRSALLVLPLLLSGCCWVCDEPDEPESPYDEVRVENHTNQTVMLRWNEGLGTIDRYEGVAAGTHKDIKLQRHDEIKADYDHLIHYYRVDPGDGPDPEHRTLVIEIGDFVPPTPSANG